MGQIALGFRSLLIKLAIFVVMAALLAWALGGTLWPRKSEVALHRDSVMIGDDEYFWLVTMPHGFRQSESASWRMMHSASGGPADYPDSHTWINGAGPVVIDKSVYYGGQRPDGAWVMVCLRPEVRTDQYPMPDRLAVEQQLQRVKAGLPLQTEDQIKSQRPVVLDPAPGTPDRQGG